MNRLWQADADAAGSAGSVPERSKIDAKDQWDVSVMFADDDAWNKEFDRLDSLVEPILSQRGQLNSAEALATFFAADTELERLIERLYVYAHLRADEDTANNDHVGRFARIRAKNTEIRGKLAWVTPEILSHSEAELAAWTDADVLKDIRHAMVKLLRRKPHTLSDKEETLLSRAGEVMATPSTAFSFLVDADMKFPSIKDSEGRDCELSQGRYIPFMLDYDRRVREDAFKNFYDTYISFKNTLACTLSSQVKMQNFNAESRNFGSALEASLHEDNVPVAVYESLIDAAHNAFGHFHEYLAIRKRSLGVDKLDMHDVYVPIVPEYEIKVPIEQARTWIMDALKPLGDEYCKVLATAFSDRWIDLYENRGKRSGAYSSGCYDSLPYILMNYQGTLDNVFTLAHELGHSMHSYLANHTQSHRYADYPIFTAEIPSTLNEALLLKHLLATTDDPKFRAYLLNHFCDSFKGTVYRQTMFAEFEKVIHELDHSGTPLTADTLSNTYYELNAMNFGDAIEADKRIGNEWSRIPHFYYNFYVYKYATSFCASQIFVERVLESEEKRDLYLNLLRSGGSNDPLVLIQAAGVDLTDRQTLESAFAGFGKSVKEFGEVLQAL